MNDHNIIAYFRNKECLDEPIRRWWENKPTKDLLSLFTDKKSRKVTMAGKELRERFVYLMYDEQKKILRAMLESGVKVNRYWAYRKLFAHWDEEFAECICHLWEKYKEDYCAWVLIEYASVKYLKIHAEELAQYGYWRICLRLANDTDFWMDESLLKPWELMYVSTKKKLEMTDEECERLLYMTIAAYLNNPQDYKTVPPYIIRAGMQCIGLLCVSQIAMVVWCMNQKKSMFVEDFKDWNLNLFKQANHLYCLDEIEKEQCKLARENFPPKYAYMLVTSLEDAPSEPAVQPTEDKYKTISVEEAMDMWKEKSPAFVKFVEQFS